MADGIKIRNLNQVSDVRNDDVLVLDRLEVDSTNSITNHITYSDFKNELFSGDVTVGGDLHVDNINIEGNITIDGGALDLDLSLNDLTDVFVPAPQANDFLMYNGAGWVVGQPQTGGGDTLAPGLADYIMFNTSNTPVVFTVTVGDKTPSNHLFGIGSDKCYYINGVEAPNLILGTNRTYIFDQSDLSNVGFEMVFYDEKNNFSGPLQPYTFGVSASGTLGIDRTLSIKFTVTEDSGLGNGAIGQETLNKLVYHSEKTLLHNHMGNLINFNANTLGLFGRESDIEALQTRLQEVETHLATLLQLE